MNGKTIVTRIAVLMLALSLASVAFTAMFLRGRGMTGSIVGLLINLVLAYFLIAGSGWARWITVVRCGFGAIFAVPVFVSLPTFGGSHFSIGGIWLLMSIAASLCIAAFLTVSKRVNEHFNPTSGF